MKAGEEMSRSWPGAALAAETAGSLNQQLSTFSRLQMQKKTTTTTTQKKKNHKKPPPPKKTLTLAILGFL